VAGERERRVGARRERGLEQRLRVALVTVDDRERDRFGAGLWVGGVGQVRRVHDVERRVRRLRRAQLLERDVLARRERCGT
jgi:hypothetical protein